MIPHERTLVKRLADQPFVLLGINSDNEERYRKERVEKEVTWPSFFDGGSTGGPIASRWGVTGWPTIYVLDHQRRIRFKGPRGEAMDEAVDQLLAELRGELPSPSTESLLEASFAKVEVSIPAVTKTPARAATLGGAPKKLDG
ncbi:MAG: hypothetical protein R3F49_23785 [Planctomycetota bacterium]